ncbi:hypothetical protein EMPS_00314 [Entomortierella parvispora]|uniref:Galactose oxidase n=1 Tax=Entomortierella parvispora TaxID=205924 RepID=A0A9P3H0F2_9FUNG|nr:hypothetical protein EMPS_00314 [Entomortierella parvispora]
MMLVPFNVSVSAQYPPMKGQYLSTYSPVSATTKTQFLILGGMSTDSVDSSGYPTPSYINQFIALDLTATWNASKPVWTNLSPPNLSMLQHSLDDVYMYMYMAVSLDGKYLNTFGRNQLRYNSVQNAWTLVTLRADSMPRLDYLSAQDRDTGLVYMAEGDIGIKNMQYMYSFDMVANTIISSVPIPAGTVAENIGSTFGRWAHYSVAYSAYRKSLLYSGRSVNGTYGTPVNLELIEFIPANNTWRTLLTQGPQPTNRIGHCMEPNEDGTKIVVFGGRLETNLLLTGELWILDVPTMTWTQGPSASQPRYESACTIVNDTLINWGGRVDEYTVAPLVLLFDLKANTFVNEYKPSWLKTPTTISVSVTTSTGRRRSDTSIPIAGETLDPNGGRNGGSHNQAAIIGGAIAGAVLLLTAMGAGFFYRRKRAHWLEPIFQTKGWSSTDHHEGDGAVSPYGSRDFETTPMRTGFLEQERQKWRGSTTSQSYMSHGRNPDEWMQKEKSSMPIDPADVVKAGVAAALEAISPREHERQSQLLGAQFREHQSFVLAQLPRARDSALLRQPWNPSRSGFDAGPSPPAAHNSSSFQQFTQPWPSSMSAVAPPQQQHQEQHWHSMQQTNLQHQYQRPASPPFPNYDTRPTVL